jgi:hypothetical protein
MTDALLCVRDAKAPLVTVESQAVVVALTL